MNKLFIQNKSEHLVMAPYGRSRMTKFTSLAVTRDDVVRYEAVTMPSTVAATGPVAAINRYDMVGTVRLGQGAPDIGNVSTGDPSSGIRTDRRQYVVSGSAIYEATSTPILSWTDTTSGWVRTKLDRVGRPVETTDFDGADLPFPFNNGGGRTTGSSGSVLILYSANEETVTDKAGKVIKTVRDGLGRVTSVVQDGNTMNYGYDALGNLVRVDQNGGGFSQVRIFVYDHHSRLLQAWQPETSPMSPTDPGDPGYRRITRRSIVTMTMETFGRAPTEGAS